MSLYRWNNIVSHINSFKTFCTTTLKEVQPENVIYPDGSFILNMGKYATPVHTSKNHGEFRVYFDDPLYYSVFCTPNRLSSVDN